MATIQNSLRIDISTDLSFVYLNARQYDGLSRKYQLIITNRNTPIKLKGTEIVTASVLRKDNVYIDTLCTWENNELYFTMTEGMLSIPGKALLEFVIYDATEMSVIGTSHVYIDIQKSLLPYDRIVKSDEFNVLNNLILQTSELLNEMGTATDTGIKRYVNVASMLNDRTLKTGDTCITAGFYNSTIGGGHYVIGTEGANGFDVLKLSNGLTAKLVNNDGSIECLGYDNTTDFGEFYTKLEPYLDAGATLKSNDLVLLTSPVYITKTINIQFNDVYQSNRTADAFVIGNTSSQVQNCIIRISKLRSVNNDNFTIATNAAVRFVNATLNDITVNLIDFFGYGLYFEPATKTCSTAQNIIYFNLMCHGNEGIVFKGKNTDWSESSWAEGNVFYGGFVNHYNVGYHAHNNIRCNAGIFMGAIDNADLENSYDIYDDSNSSAYFTANLFLLNFVRHTNSIIQERNTVLEPGMGLTTAGQIRTMSSILLGTGNNSIALSEGFAKFTNETRPYIDFRRSTSEDRISRLILEDNDSLHIQSGSRTRRDHGAEISNDYVKFVGGGIATAKAGTTMTEISFDFTMPDTNYVFVCTPHFVSTCAVTGKTTTSCIVSHADPGSDSSLEFFALGFI